MQIPEVFEFLLTEKRKQYRYINFPSGRGSGKSMNAHGAITTVATTEDLKIVCARELMNTIKHSVHSLISRIIRQEGLFYYWKITDESIKGRNGNGSEFIFKGLRSNIEEFMSMDDIDILLIEEAAGVSLNSLEVVRPTIRKPGSQIISLYNRQYEDDPIDKVAREYIDQKRVYRKHLTYKDNPFFPEELEMERQDCLKNRPEEYPHIWLGHTKKLSSSIIFKGKFSVVEFDTPADAELGGGADWGFGSDPNVLTRSFVKDDCLFIDYEAGLTGMELDGSDDANAENIGLEQLWNTVPNSKEFTIWADNSRPELVKYMQKKGFKVVAAPKWPGSVEDGITTMRHFKAIYIHPRCVKTIEEFQKYAYKISKITNQPLPEIVDKFNHYIDSLRYRLTEYITTKASNNASDYFDI